MTEDSDIFYVTIEAKADEFEGAMQRMRKSLDVGAAETETFRKAMWWVSTPATRATVMGLDPAWRSAIRAAEKREWQAQLEACAHIDARSLCRKCRWGIVDHHGVDDTLCEACETDELIGVLVFGAMTLFILSLVMLTLNGSL